MKLFYSSFCLICLMINLTVCSSPQSVPIIKGGSGYSIPKPGLFGSRGYEIRSPVSPLNQRTSIEFQHLPLSGPNHPYYLQLRFLRGEPVHSIVLAEGLDPIIELEMESSGLKRTWKGPLSNWILTGYRDLNDDFYYPFPDQVFNLGKFQSSKTMSRVSFRISGAMGHAQAYELRVRSGGTL